MNHLNHRSVEPDCVLNLVVDSASVAHFLDDSGCVHVACLKRMDVDLSVLVDKLCAERAYFLSNELSENLCRICGSSRVVLQ